MLIYFAGHKNKKNMETEKIEKSGYAVIEPGNNIKNNLEILARCDALVVLNKENSDEITFANERNIPVYTYPDLPEKSPTELLSPVQCTAFIDTIMAMYRLHLRKNSDYSPANIIGTGELGVVVRLWDKIARLLNLHGFRMHIERSTFEAPREPKNESIEDAYYDTAVYGIIGLLVRKGAWGR